MLSEVTSLLHPDVVKLMERRGFRQLTPIQCLAIPRVLEGKNVLIIAPTGSGKTEAAVLPILSKLCQLRDEGRLERGIYVLYITPLRALNRDLLERLKWWCENLGLKVDVRHGDTDVRDRARQSRDPPHILITTPEMLQAILLGRRLREHLRKLRWIIVDEVHELVEDKRGVQLVLTISRIRWMLGRDVQIIALSATVGDPDKVARFITGSQEYEIVQVSHVREMILDVVLPQPEDVDHEIARKIFATPEVAAKLRYMKKLIEEHGSTIIFVNTRSMAENLAARFHAWLQDYPIAVHHGSLSKTVREGIEHMLRTGKLRAVIATSSLELGIDIGHVDLVIQYTSPHQVTRLLQRVGRSGHRLDKMPKGVIVVHDFFDALEAIAIVKKAREGYLEPVKIPEKPYDVLCNQIVACTLMQGRLKIDELYTIVRSAYPYRDLDVSELHRVLTYMSDVLYPPLIHYDKRAGTIAKPIRKRARRETYNYFFNNLSMIPEEKQYHVVNVKTGEYIGVLDEAFVAEYAQPGIKFVFRGKVWEIVDILRDRILVEEAPDPIGAIPAWIGEEIPVPFDIAQDVGRIISKIVKLLDENNNDVDEVSKIVHEEFKINENTIKYIVEKIYEQRRFGYPIPSHDKIIIEKVGPLYVIYAMFGTLVNRTLSKLLSEYIVEKFRISVREFVDPYAMVFQFSQELDVNTLRDVIYEVSNLDMNTIKRLIISASLRSGSFKRRFIHVARRFNAIPKDADMSSVSISLILESFKDTPVFEEALREYFEKDLDIDTTLEVLNMIRSGQISVEAFKYSEPSPLTQELINRISGKLELLGPEGHKLLTEISFKARILNDCVTLVCANCYWSARLVVREIERDVRCPECGCRKVGVLRLPEDRARKAVECLRKRLCTSSEYTNLKYMIERTGSLVDRYGKYAIYALCTKLSIDDVEAILDDLVRKSNSEEEFLEKLSEVEREVIKGRFFK